VVSDIVEDNSVVFDGHDKAMLISDRGGEKTLHFSCEPMQLQGWREWVANKRVKLLLHELTQLGMFSQKYAQATAKTRRDEKLVQSTRITRRDLT